MKEFNVKWLTDPQVFNINRIDYHTHFIANEDKYNKKISLNGNWWFNYSKNSDVVNWDFKNDYFDCRAWEKIKVPAHIQLEGYDKPHYVNRMYPWDGVEAVEPPEVPKRLNPVAQYAKYIDVADTDNRTFISFQGVETAFAIWVNGKFVGYSEDSYTPSDFELTDYIIKGENKIAVAVFKFSTGSWLEDQDFWRMSGIMRDVYLYTTPKMRIWDFYYKTNVDPLNRKATTSLEVKVENGEECKVRYNIVDTASNKIVDNEAVVSSNVVNIEDSLSDIKLWSAEQPNLYTLHIELVDNKGSVLQSIDYKVGYKRSEIIDGIWYMNGKRLVINGVNRILAIYMVDVLQKKRCDGI